MPEEKRPLKVFLCHAHSDADTVHTLYDRLTRDGVNAWLDKEKLIPGQDWEYEIRKAVRESDVVVVCHSRQFNQRGFRQKEVKIALEEADLFPKGEIFIIPARLEECELLDDLERFHWVDLFAADGYGNLLRALRLRANHIGASLRVKKNWMSRLTSPRPKSEKILSEKKSSASKQEKPEVQSPAPEIAKSQPESVAGSVIVAGDGNVINAGKQEVFAPATPEPVEVQKPVTGKTKTLKPNTGIVVALITLAGAIITVLLASPILENLFARTPEPTFTFAPPTHTFTSPTKTKTSAPSLTPTRTFTPTITPTKSVTPTPTDYPAEISDVDPSGNPISMRLVPAGKFTMGSEKYDDEKPIHEVALDVYYMDTYEVTNALYKACVTAGVCDPPINTDRYDNTYYERHPVVYVDWYMAKTYCEWRGAGLPTEAQWEKAARGTDGRTYPWGEGIDCSKANYSDLLTQSLTCIGDSRPVGNYKNKISPYGLYDMSGNVWEWVNSLYQPYPYSATDGREDLSTSGARVKRGGSWVSIENYARSSYRGKSASSTYGYDVGFRCARSP